MELTETLLDKSFTRQSGRLSLDGCDLVSLADSEGTPFYAYGQHVLQRSWRSLRRTYPSEIEIYYSIKANPHQSFLRYFVEKGCGLEVASGGEMQLALAAGCPPASVIFAGPGKTDNELQEAVDKRIGEIHVESVGELRRLDRIASRNDLRVAVALRVNPNLATSVGSLAMGGRPSPFGIDEDQLDSVLAEAAGCSSLDVVGLHLNTATQILDVAVLMAYYRHAIQLAGRVAPALRQGIRSLDLGGGLGVPYCAGQTHLDLESLRRALEELVRDCRAHSKLRDTTLMIEPGRFLVAECGVYVMRVVDVKFSRHQTFVVTDGGMHHHAAATGNFGQTFRRPFPIAVANRSVEPSQSEVAIVGPLCTPLDVFARKLPLDGIREGDLLVVLQSGAYSRTASALQFLSHPSPPEFWLNSGHVQSIRRRGTWQDELRGVTSDINGELQHPIDKA